MIPTQTMLNYVKTLSDAERLKVIGVLAVKPSSSAEIAKELKLPARQLFSHLGMLEQEGFIVQEESIYRLDLKKIEKIFRENFGKMDREIFKPEEGSDLDRRKILVNFLNPDGSIRQLPSDHGKLEIILNYLLKAFQPGVIYTEREINNIIKPIQPDTAGLRRDLIDRGLLMRKSDGSQYWRPE